MARGTPEIVTLVVRVTVERAPRSSSAPIVRVSRDKPATADRDHVRRSVEDVVPGFAWEPPHLEAESSLHERWLGRGARSYEEKEEKYEAPHEFHGGILHCYQGAPYDGDSHLFRASEEKVAVALGDA